MKQIIKEIWTIIRIEVAFKLWLLAMWVGTDDFKRAIARKVTDIENGFQKMSKEATGNEPNN